MRRLASRVFHAIRMFRTFLTFRTRPVRMFRKFRITNRRLNVMRRADGDVND